MCPFDGRGTVAHSWGVRMSRARASKPWEGGRYTPVVIEQVYPREALE